MARDVALAAAWYAKSAAQGFAVAQYNLGTCYENGKSVAQDAALAAKWYAKAAAQGHESAAAVLSRLAASRRAS